MRWMKNIKLRLKNSIYYRRLEEKKFAKGYDKTTKELYDKIDTKSSPNGVKDMHFNYFSTLP